MSLYHSGVRPESQSKATSVMTTAKMAIQPGANFRARTLNAGSLDASWRIDPRTSTARPTRHKAKQTIARAEKNGRPSQNALPARIGFCSASGRVPG